MLLIKLIDLNEIYSKHANVQSDKIGPLKPNMLFYSIVFLTSNYL